MQLGLQKDKADESTKGKEEMRVSEVSETKSTCNYFSSLSNGQGIHELLQEERKDEEQRRKNQL